MSYARILQSGGISDVSPAPSSDRATAIRNVLVHINGNRVTWEHLGMHGAVWRVNAEHAGTIFSYSNDTTCCKNGSGHVGETDDRLTRAMIKRVCLLESNTNIDDVVGISVDGLPSHEYTSNGVGVSCFLTGAGRSLPPLWPPPPPPFFAHLMCSRYPE